MMGEGQYAVGIEPCTNGFGRDEVRRAGELIVLQPGEKRIYDLEVGAGRRRGDRALPGSRGPAAGGWRCMTSSVSER